MMKTIEVMAEAICANDSWTDHKDYHSFARSGLEAIKEPDPHVVAAVADKLNMDAVKVAAVWILCVEECLK